MNKTVAGLAVVGGLVVAMTAAADPVLYGRLHASVDVLDGQADAAEYGVVSRRSLVGVTGAGDAGGDLRLLYTVEWKVDIATVDEEGEARGDVNISAGNQVVGFAGPFGALRLGRHHSPYEMSTADLNVFDDTLADYENVVQIANRYGNLVAYQSPEVSGVRLDAALAAGNNEAFGDQGRENPAVLSYALRWEDGPWFLAAAREEAPAIDLRSTKGGVGYSAESGRFAAVYERGERAGEIGLEAWNALVVNASFIMGPNSIHVQGGRLDRDEAPVARTYALGVEHAFSPRSRAYVIYAHADEDLDLVGAYADSDSRGRLSGLSMGLVHGF